MPSHYPDDIERHINANVLAGKDGFLFLWQGSQKQFDYLTGLAKPSEKSIKNFSNNIKSRKSYLDRYGIEYRHIVFPSKPTVYDDHLPCELKLRSLYETYYPKIDNVFYSKKLLCKQKFNGLKPFRTLDTHLTDYGFLSCLKDALPDEFQSIRGQNYTYKAVKKMLSGDLEKMIRKGDKLTVPENVMKAFDSYGSSIIFEEYDNIQDLPGNTGNIVIVRSLNSFNNKRLLVFGDSFIRKGLHLLSPIYSEIIYFRSQFFRPEIVNIFRPNIVITANAERYLSTVQSDEESPFWCCSDFKNSSELSGNKNSMRLLFHLRGLSNRYFDNDQYQLYLENSSYSLRQIINSHQLPIDRWLKDPVQGSVSQNIINIINSGNLDSLRQIKFDPVERTSPSNGSIRSLAGYVYRGEINTKYSSKEFIEDLFAQYDLRNLGVLSLLRIENILSHAKDVQLNKFEASELFCACNILANLLAKHDKDLVDWLVKIFEILITQASKKHLAELFKACYLFRPYLIVLDLALPELTKTINHRDQNAIKNYFEKINKSDYSPPEFIELIKDKSVAIVGPSSSGQTLGNEIDTFDTVIRMSVDNLSDLDHTITGNKVTISYFSGHTAKSQQKIIDLVNQVPFVSISLPKFAPLLFDLNNKIYESKYSHVRKTVMLKHVSKFQVYTSPNLLQVILVDILRYNPSRVKVFYSNMFAKKTYDSNYKSVEGLRQRSGEFQRYSLSSLTMINHDPISNFLLVKSLFESKLLEADPILSEVLNMSPEQYLDSLKTNITLI